MFYAKELLNDESDFSKVDFNTCERRYTIYFR